MDGLVRIFMKTVQVGMQAGAAVFVVLACRQLFLKKQPRNVCCLLWVLIFLRFLCPVTWNVALPVPQAWSQKADSWRAGWQEQDFMVSREPEKQIDGGAVRDGAETPPIFDAEQNGAETQPIIDAAQNSEAAQQMIGAARDGAETPPMFDPAQKDTGAAQEAAAFGAAQAEAGAAGKQEPFDVQSGKAESAVPDAQAAGNGSNAAGPGIRDAQNGADAGAALHAAEAGSGQESLEKQLHSAWSEICGRFLQPVHRKRLLQGIAVLWLTGVLVLGGTAVVRYAALKRRLRFAVRSRFGGQEIWETDQITDPFVMGIIDPAIYLPTGLSEMEKCHIIAHERAHIERRDYLVKIICYLGTVFQWMNPFAWTAFYFYNQDMEMACDERAVKSLGRKARLDYSRTLLLTAARGSGLALPVFFGESNAKRRVENILRKKKRTVAGGCLAVILVCALAALLFTRTGGENGSGSDMPGQTEAGGNGSDMPGQTGAEGSGADVPGQAEGSGADGAETEETQEEISSPEKETGKVEAYPYVEAGELNVKLFNFTGWDYMYVNQVDFRLEQLKGEQWEVVEPDRTVNRISSQSKLYQLDSVRELGGLLAAYKKDMEDGTYRLVLYCQDTPVEDPDAVPEEVYAEFSWKDNAPEDALALQEGVSQQKNKVQGNDNEAAESWTMQERIEEAQERYLSAAFPGSVSFFYTEEAASEEEEIRRRKEQYQAILESMQAKIRLYEEKLGVIEARMEHAGPQQQEDYDAFCQQLWEEVKELKADLAGQKEIRIDGEDITQKRVECEAVRKKLKGEISYIEKRQEIQERLMAEIEKAEEKEKQPLVDAYNEKVEFMQQLQEQKIRLQEQVHELNQEISRCRLLEWMGYDFVEAQKKELEKFPKNLGVEEAERYGIRLIRRDGDSSEMRGELYQFWLETEGTGQLPETMSAVELSGGAVSTEEKDEASETLYSRVKSMTFLFGTETEEGDLVLTSVTAWGSGYLILVDQSRDRSREQDAEDINIYCYDRLHWLVSPGGGLEYAVASNEWKLTSEQWTESLLSSTWNGDADRLLIACMENH